MAKKWLKKISALAMSTILAAASMQPVAAAETTNAGSGVAVLEPGVITDKSGNATGSLMNDICTKLGISADKITAVEWSSAPAPDGVTTVPLETKTTGSAGNEVTSDSYIGAWLDGTTIKLYSKAGTIYANAKSDGLFYQTIDESTSSRLTGLTSVDLSRINWSKTTRVVNMFLGTSSLKTIDLSSFSTANFGAGGIDSPNDVQYMFTDSGVETLTLPSNWKFPGATGLKYNWINQDTGKTITSYDLEYNTDNVGGTWKQTKTDIPLESGADEVYEASGLAPDNLWGIHSINSTLSAFCIDADDPTTEEKEAGAGDPYGYYNKVKVTDSSLLTNGVKDVTLSDGTKEKVLDSSAGYLNSSNSGYAPLGNDMREALITLLYYGPQIYDLTKKDDCTKFQNDIWHFTNFYNDSTWNSSTWEGKTYDSIPNKNIDLYIYVSKSSAQNLIGLDVRKTPETNITVSKVNDSNQMLADAKMKITGDSLDAPITFTSDDSKSQELTLKAGTYTLSEIEAPSGYSKAADITFVVTSDGKVTIDGKTIANNAIVMTDSISTHTVTIKKIANDTKQTMLAGAEMKISGGNLAEPITFTSDSEDAKSVTLKAGTYTLSETKAPEGFDKAADITFKVDDDGTVTIDGKTVANGTILMTDTEKKYSVKLQKISDKTDANGNAIPVENATLHLEGTDILGRSIALESDVITAATGEVEVNGLYPGSYTLTEKAAPKGYNVAPDIKFTLNADGTLTVSGEKVDAIVMKDLAVENGTLKISKQDFGGKEIKDAVLTVTGKTEDGSAITPITFTTDGETVHNIVLAKKASDIADDKAEHLLPGDYTLTETTAPEGYIKAESINFTITSDLKVMVDGQDANGQIIMKDDYAKHNVEISKQDIAGKEIAGATLTVTGTDSSGNDVSLTFETDGKEPHKFSLRPGTYTLTEITAPDGYEKAESIKFTVDVTGKVTVNDEEVKQVVMTDQYVHHDVTIKKVDENGKIVKGAELTITGKEVSGAEVKPVSFTTGDSDTTISVKPGSYKITETKVPEGYEKAEEVSFEIGTNDALTVNGQVATAITIVDKTKTYPIVFSKADVDGKEIAGAKLTITHEEKTVVNTDDGKKDSSSTDESASTGKSSSTGESASAGETSSTGASSSTGESAATGKTGKADADTKNSSSSSDASSKTVETKTVTDYSWISEEGKTRTFSLSAGTYTMHETGAPDGYVKASDIEFTVNQDGTVAVDKKDVGKVTMTDVKTKVTVTKVDKSTEKALAGAKMELTDSTGKLVASWTTGTTPYVIEGKLKEGASYTLHEASAPEGYTVAQDVTFTMGSKSLLIIVKDTPKPADTTTPGKITVKKADESGNTVTGAQLQLKDGSTVLETWTSNSAPHVVAAKLTVGKTYTIHESSVPSGYKQASDITFTVGTTDQTLTVVDVKQTSTTGTVTVNKKDQNGAMLSGAQIDIRNSNGDTIESWTTDGTSHTVATKLNVGQTYYVHESGTPQGYQTAADIPFTMDGGAKTINMIDAKVKAGSVSVEKVDEDGKAVTGASMQLINAAKIVLETWTTDSSAYTLKTYLVPGAKYTIHEVKAPDGYEIAGDITFTETASDQTISMIDKKKNSAAEYVTLKIGKISGDDTTTTVKGASMQLQDKDGKVLDSWTTDGTNHVVQNLAQKDQTYIIHEVSAPDGFEAARDVSFVASGNMTILIKDYPTSQGRPGDSSTSTTSNVITPSNTETTDAVVSYSTGDSSHIGLWIAGIGAAAAAVATILILKKRKRI